MSLKEYKKLIERSMEILSRGILIPFLQTVPVVDTVTSEVTTKITEPAESGISISPIVPVFLIIFVLFCGAAVLFFFSIKLRRKIREEKSREGVLFEVAVPKGNEIEIEVAKQMFANLHGIGKLQGIKKLMDIQDVISFEIVGLPESIRYYVYSPKKIASLVEKAINGAYANAELTIVEDYNIFQDGAKVSYTSLKLSEEQYKPIRIFEDLKGDPMTNLTSALAKFNAGEGGAIQILITPDNTNTSKDGRKYVGRVEETNADPEKKKINISQEALQRIDRKVGHLMFRTVINIVCSSATKDVAQSNLDNIVGAFNQFAAPEGNKFTKDEGSKLAPKRDFMSNFIYRRMPLTGGSSLNIEELATVYHFPNNTVETPYIKWLLSKRIAAPENLPTEGLFLGRSDYRGTEKDIFMKDDGNDRRRHMYIIGQTGTGKSRFMTSLLMQDIYAGRGCAYIDPHGSDLERVLAMIPPERAEDVIYFNPADTERPIGWNIMDYYDEQDKHIVVNSFIGMLKKMYDPHNQGITGPIFERSVRNGMLTAMAKKGSTLVEVLRILMDTNMEYVKKEFFPYLKDDVVKSYWEEEFASTDKFHKSEKLGYITSKFDTFVTNTLMRNIIGQSESTISIREVMDNRKILLINLSKGFIGEENSNFLGLLLVPAILRAALSRNDIPEEERKDFYMYVDEFQNFATDEFATILAEARKYRLNLIVGNQYIAQLSDQIREAVFGNAGSKFVFRVGAKDAEYLVEEYAPAVESQDMVNMPNYTCYSKILVDGVNPSPFSMRTQLDESMFLTDKQIKENIINLSRFKYGRDKDIVEQEIRVRSRRDESLKAKQTQPPPAFPRF